MVYWSTGPRWRLCPSQHSKKYTKVSPVRQATRHNGRASGKYQQLLSGRPVFAYLERPHHFQFLVDANLLELAIKLGRSVGDGGQPTGGIQFFQITAFDVEQFEQFVVSRGLIQWQHPKGGAAVNDLEALGNIKVAGEEKVISGW